MPADFRPTKPQFVLPDQTPKVNVRLGGMLRGPDGRTLLNPPTIELNELFKPPSSPTKENKMHPLFKEPVAHSAKNAGSVRESLRMPLLYDNLPSVDISNKAFEKKSFLNDPFDRFRPMIDERDDFRKSGRVSELPPLPNWERNFDPPTVKENNMPHHVPEPKEIPTVERFEDVDVFLARKKGVEQPKVEYVAESTAEPITVLKRVVTPIVRVPREAVFRRKRQNFVPNIKVMPESTPESTSVCAPQSIPEKNVPVQTPVLTDELLHTENLTKSYYKKKLKIPVLKGVNLSIRTGEFVSIIGQSGSGKSTLLHLLGTLDVPESGAIYFENRRIDNLSNSKRDFLRNKSIGFIFQFYHLLPELTTLENVLSPLMIRDGVISYFFRRCQYIELAKELLDKVGLSHRLKHKPCELSGGEMQRAAIARALISEPKFLLADEPTGNLDAASAAEIIELLQGIKAERKLTILMVTHDNQIATAADRIVQMVDGIIDNH